MIEYIQVATHPRHPLQLFSFQDAAIKALVSNGADKSKLIVGIPLYGQTFELKSPDEHDLGSDVVGPGSPGPFTSQPGMMAFYEICSKS